MLPSQFFFERLPFPVSVNACYADVIRRCRGKAFPKRVLTKEGEAYRHALLAALRDSGKLSGLQEFIDYHQTVDLHVYLFRPDWFCQNGAVRKVDRSNYLKVVEDVVFPSIDRDDSLIFGGDTRKMYSEEKYMTLVFTAMNERVDEF